MDTNTLGDVLTEYAGKGSEEDKKNIIKNIIDFMNVEYKGEYDLEVTVEPGGKTKNSLIDTYNIKRNNSTWYYLMAFAKVLHWLAVVIPSDDIKDDALQDLFLHFYEVDFKTEVKIESKYEKKKSKDGKKKSKDGKKKKTEEIEETDEETKTWNLNPLVYAAAFNNPRVYKVLSDCKRFPRWHADENMIGNILEEAKKICDECSKVCDPKEVNKALLKERREAKKIPIKSRVSKSLHTHLKF